MICEVCHQHFSAHVPECCPDCQKAVENEGVEEIQRLTAENERLVERVRLLEELHRRQVFLTERFWRQREDSRVALLTNVQLLSDLRKWATSRLEVLRGWHDAGAARECLESVVHEIKARAVLGEK